MAPVAFGVLATIATVIVAAILVGAVGGAVTGRLRGDRVRGHSFFPDPCAARPRRPLRDGYCAARGRPLSDVDQAGMGAARGTPHRMGCGEYVRRAHGLVAARADAYPAQREMRPGGIACPIPALRPNVPATRVLPPVRAFAIRSNACRPPKSRRRSKTKPRA